MRLIYSFILLFVVVGAAHSQEPLQRRLNDVCAIISGSGLHLDTVFAASFLKQVPAEQLVAGVKQITAGLGFCISTRIVESTGAYKAKAEATTSNGYTIPISIGIESQPPYHIEALFLKMPVKDSKNIEAVIEAIKALPGETSFFAKNLSTCAVIGIHDTTSYLPIGSTFKLYILGELARSIEAGQHQWSDVIQLDTNLFSLPSGVMQSWPHGSPVTLHTLAAEMISISDNTATDHLLNYLDADNVQKNQAAMGHSDPSLNDPFMSTRQLFILKFSDSARRAATYASLNVAERKKMLTKISQTVSRNDVNFIDTVVMPDKLEWFARTPDLVRAMSWLKNASDEPHTQALRGILSINPGLNIDTATWTYIGYKGGSETGVLNMTFLLQHKNGHWYSLSASWLGTDAPVELVSFAGLIERAIQLLAP